MSRYVPEGEEDDIDARVEAERNRVVELLRNVIERIDGADVDRLTEGLAWIAAATEPLVRTVDRALGRPVASSETMNK